MKSLISLTLLACLGFSCSNESNDKIENLERAEENMESEDSEGSTDGDKNTPDFDGEKVSLGLLKLVGSWSNCEYSVEEGSAQYTEFTFTGQGYVTRIDKTFVDESCSVSISEEDVEIILSFFEEGDWEGISKEELKLLLTTGAVSTGTFKVGDALDEGAYEIDLTIDQSNVATLASPDTQYLSFMVLDNTLNFSQTCSADEQWEEGDDCFEKGSLGQSEDDRSLEISFDRDFLKK